MLDTYGWSQTLQHQFTDHAARGLLPARVNVQQRGLYRLATREGEVSAELSGKFLHEALTGDHPVAGDWVACMVRLACVARSSWKASPNPKKPLPAISRGRCVMRAVTSRYAKA